MAILLQEEMMMMAITKKFGSGGCDAILGKGGLIAGHQPAVTTRENRAGYIRSHSAEVELPGGTTH